MRRPGATFLLATLIAALTVLGTTTATQASKKFHIDLGDERTIVGTFGMTSLHEIYVEIAWLLDGQNKTFLPIGGVAEFNIHGLSGVMGGGGAEFIVAPLTPQYRLVFAYPTGYGGPLEPGEWVGTYDEQADHSVEIDKGRAVTLANIIVREVW